MSICKVIELGFVSEGVSVPVLNANDAAAVVHRLESMH